MAGGRGPWAREDDPIPMSNNKMMYCLFTDSWLRILPIHFFLVLLAQRFWGLYHFYLQLVDLMIDQCENRSAMFGPKFLPAACLRFFQRFGVPRFYHLVIPVLGIIMVNKVGQRVSVFSIFCFHVDMITDGPCYLPQNAALSIDQKFKIGRNFSFNGIFHDGAEFSVAPGQCFEPRKDV